MKILSLGVSCFPKRYIDEIHQTGPTNLFDYTGASMWTICKLFNEDFKGLDIKEDYRYVKLFDTDVRMRYCNLPLYFRPVHDFPFSESLETTISQEDFDVYVAKLNRRIIRLKETLSNSKEIIFIRHEETIKDRIMSYHPNMLGHDEYTDLINFVSIIKRLYPNLSFKVFYITSKPKSNFIKHESIKIIHNKETVSWSNAGKIFDKLLRKKLDKKKKHK